MKPYNSDELAYLAAGNIRARGLIWVKARNRTTGLFETMGLWSGDDHQAFTINGQERSYYAVGSVLDLAELRSQVGVSIRDWTLSLSGLSAAVQQLVKGYQVRFAPVEVHRAWFHVDTNELVAPPRRVFKGWVDKANWSGPTEGGTYTCALRIENAARALTRTLALKFSDASQRLVDTSDLFFQYADIGQATVWWGEKRIDATSMSLPTSGGWKNVKQWFGRSK